MVEITGVFYMYDTGTVKQYRAYIISRRLTRRLLKVLIGTLGPCRLV